ncbi:MAG: redoxin domain-containing protein [Gammaproteobacteria bacterium]|nr:redoxin domain-containing protein [Gammaproteobacteria bacterium]MDE2346708.1 redoxin domain-containing protein [Gammaproteobacteria bacterium]
MPSLAGTQPAPAFPTGLDWINTGGRPVTLKELRGKVVLLDFWTYGCINCFHVIPDLDKLQKNYGNKLVIIGVHSAKFATERKTAHIEAVVLRYGIDHPVVNDKNMQIWNEYGAEGWPTLTVIDPAGKVVGQVAGEGHYDVLNNAIGSLIREFSAKGLINPKPLWFSGIHLEMPKTTLLFPGKVLADADHNRLFIADSNHNRILETTLAGKVLAVIGSGRLGLRNGSYANARFHYPQGMALAGADILYVADTDNNAIRKINLQTHTVSTVAGNGQQTYMTETSMPTGKAELNTPWAVLVHDGLLYIAMAGQHQLWTYDPATDTISLYAGSGQEGIQDGSLLDASFAQSSGLTTDGRYLYVADPEASAVRQVGFGPGAQVRTLVGTGLFDFGDVDGVGDAVRLQHDLGIAWHEGELYIADTYNSKIKKLDPKTRRVTTIAGGHDEFDEPGGLSAAGDNLYIADTDHNRIAVLNLKTGRLASLKITDPQKLLPP